MTEPWFDPIRFGVLYGAIGGNVLGVLCGIPVAASGYLAPSGKGRSFVLGAFTTLLMVGVLHPAPGIFALVTGQPYAVWYAFILVGVILAVVMGILLAVVRRRYAEARRIGAAVLRHS